MAPPRTMLLFDPDARPQSWSERLAQGEYAVLYSITQPTPEGLGSGPFCTVFDSLAEAEAYANEQVRQQPPLRCRIYDHHGLGGEPVREIRGAAYKGEGEMSARFRRWIGAALFFGGLGLMALDWSEDFTLLWPSTVGMRMIPAGLILLLIELVIVIEARRKKRRMGQGAG
jgi:hypothetical protein